MANPLRNLYRQMYPDMRRKDAGYLATVLSDYAGVSWQRRKARLANFDEVENCYWSLRLNRRVDGLAMRRMMRGIAEAAPDAVPATAPPLVDRRNAQSTAGYLRQLFQLEKAVLDLQSLPQIIARTPILVERFRIVAGDKADSLKRRYDQQLSDERLEKIWRAWSDRHADGEQADGAAPVVALLAATPAVRAGTRGGANGGANNGANIGANIGAKIPLVAVDSNGEAWLRAKLNVLLADIQWWCAQTQVREELFFGQQMQLVGWFLLFTLGASISYLSGISCTNVKTVIAVAFFGSLGAFISIMRRMHNDIERHGGSREATYKELTALAYGKLGIGFGLVFGATFTLVLMLVFYGEVAGNIFSNDLSAVSKGFSPNFPLTSSGALPLSSASAFGCDSLRVNSGADLGKLLSWSFLAGFAEKMVPDALDRLTISAAPKKG